MLTRHHSAAMAAVTVAACMLPGGAAAQEQGRREFISFLWGSGIEGRAGIGNAAVDVDAGFDDLIDFVDLGASFRYRATRDGLGWFLEGNYVRLDSTRGGPANASVELTTTLGDLGVSKTLREGLAVYAGLRAQSLDLEVRVAPSVSRGEDTSWVDGIVGLQWVPLDEGPWTAWVRGDVGGGGSDGVWLAEVGGGYRFGGIWSAYLAYRRLSTDYDDDDFIYDVEQSGLAFGFGFSF